MSLLYFQKKNKQMWEKVTHRLLFLEQVFQIHNSEYELVKT
jgi:hypothetical protein